MFLTWRGFQNRHCLYNRLLWICSGDPFGKYLLITHLCQAVCHCHLVMTVMSKTGLCFQRALRDLFSVANHTNKPIMTHQWVLYSWTCGHRWWCLEGVVFPLLDSALLFVILRRLHVVAWAHHVDSNVRKKEDC